MDVSQSAARRPAAILHGIGQQVGDKQLTGTVAIRLRKQHAIASRGQQRADLEHVLARRHLAAFDPAVLAPLEVIQVRTVATIGDHDQLLPIG
jgi:hypothetical protein